MGSSAFSWKPSPDINLGYGFCISRTASHADSTKIPLVVDSVLTAVGQHTCGLCWKADSLQCLSSVHGFKERNRHHVHDPVKDTNGSACVLDFATRNFAQLAYVLTWTQLVMDLIADGVKPLTTQASHVDIYALWFCVLRLLFDFFGHLFIIR